jgi:hypothetical protein
VVKELRACLESAGRASGEPRERLVDVVDRQTSPERLQEGGAILAALMAWPEARAAASGRLLELEVES